MNNSNITYRNNQAFSKEYISILYWMGGELSGYNNYEPLSIPFVFTQTRKKILSVILKYTGLYKDAYISQDKIAQLSNCHHDTVLRAIKLFVDLGLLKKKYRGANRTCVYSLTSFFHHPKVQWALKDILTNLYWSIQSGVRRCQSFLKGLCKAIFKPITARLSNDKNKYINSYEKNKNNHIKIQKQEPQKTIIYEPDQDHDRLFNEFSKILNIET